MNCLTNYIGVLGCGSNVPDSGVYINSLPSINLRQLQGIADDEQENFLGVWNDVQVRSQNKLLVDVSSALRKRFKLNSFIESFKLVEEVDSLTTYPALAEERGFSYDLQWFTGFIYKSDFYMINIEYIKIYLSQVTTNPLAISIKDIDSDEVLYTKSLLVADQIAGWNLVKVNKGFLNQRIKVVYDAAEVDSISTDQHKLTHYGNAYALSGNGGYLRGIKGSLLSNNSYGLVAKISLTCTYEPIICGNKDLFSAPLLYLLGAETMVERIYSDRLNEFTTVRLDEAKELHSYFLSEYEKGLDNVISGLNISLNDVCIECNNPIRVIESHP